MQLTESIEARFLSGLGGAADVPLGLAVSGGGDSMALLHLAHRAGCRIAAATVDHGLRAEAAGEAAMVARACAELGVPHVTLHWRWDGRGNLPDAARRGRIDLLARWAKGQGLAAVALGHSCDDVAETLLMRLDRKAGVDGLAAMAARRNAAGTEFIRPLLSVRRGELREWLRARAITWVEDPSNDDPAYDRTRARARVAAEGGPDALAALAHGYATLRHALEHRAGTVVARAVAIDRGDVLLDLSALSAAGPDARRRILQAALIWVASAEYGPRSAALARFWEALAARQPAALMGVAARVDGTRIRLYREARAVQGHGVPAGAIWDGRWQVTGPENNGLTIRALGASGLALCPDWRATGLPRASLVASPAVWRGDGLVAAPLAGKGAGWTARAIPPCGLLANAALSH